MKTRRIGVVLVLTLLASAAALCSADEPREGRAYIGVGLDLEPLPEILYKHLGLEPGQGVRVSNVMRNSPADEAGLEKDDIVIAFNGRVIEPPDSLIDALAEASVGDEVTLEVIHRGDRKTVELKLGEMPEEPQWKYPPEPEVFEAWRPGRMFRREPGMDRWEELDIPEVRVVGPDFGERLKECYFFRHGEGEEAIEVRIEGNPDDPDAVIMVRAGDERFDARVGELGRIPERFRKVVEEDLETAREASRRPREPERFRVPGMPERRGWRGFFRPEQLERLFREEQLKQRLREKARAGLEAIVGPDRERLDRMEEQMRRLQRHLEELEHHFNQMFGRILERLDERPGYEEDNEQLESGEHHDGDEEGEHEERDVRMESQYHHGHDEDLDRDEGFEHDEELGHGEQFERDKQEFEAKEY